MTFDLIYQLLACSNAGYLSGQPRCIIHPSSSPPHPPPPLPSPHRKNLPIPPRHLLTPQNHLPRRPQIGIWSKPLHHPRPLLMVHMSQRDKVYFFRCRPIVLVAEEFPLLESCDDEVNHELPVVFHFVVVFGGPARGRKGLANSNAGDGVRDVAEVGGAADLLGGEWCCIGGQAGTRRHCGCFGGEELSICLLYGGWCSRACWSWGAAWCYRARW
jgi:hypothetical protein